MSERKRIFRLWATRAVVYLVLGMAAFLMLFPFTYMVFTSFKASGDVFRYPPRLLPYSSVTASYAGKEAPLYRFEIDGRVRELVLTDAKETLG